MVKKKLKGLILVIILLGVGNNISSHKLNFNIMEKMDLDKYTNKIKPYVQVINQKMQYIKDPSLNPKYMPEEQKKLTNGYKKEIQNINGKEITIWKGDFTGNPYDNGVPWMGGKRLDFFDKTFDREGIQKNKYNEPERVWKDKLVKNAILMHTFDRTDTYTLIDYSEPFHTKNVINNNTIIKLYGIVSYADDSGIKLDDGKYYAIKNDCVLLIENLSQTSGIAFNPSDFPKNALVCITYFNDEIISITRFCIIQ